VFKCELWNKTTVSCWIWIYIEMSLGDVILTTLYLSLVLEKFSYILTPKTWVELLKFHSRSQKWELRLFLEITVKWRQWSIGLMPLFMTLPLKCCIFSCLEIPSNFVTDSEDCIVPIRCSVNHIMALVQKQ
jgi:hypothetical protein